MTREPIILVEDQERPLIWIEPRGRDWIVDALVVAAVEKLDERLRAMSLLDRATQQEEVTRLMRERYVAMGRRLDELRQRAVMVPA